MDPNQQNVPPPNDIPAQPVAIQSAPEPPYQPYVPQQVEEAPSVSQQAYAPTPAPQPDSSSVNNVPVSLSIKKSPKKLVIIIAAFVAGLVVLGVGAWLVITLFATSNITLKEYSNDEYSLLVPESYTQDINATGATFVEPKAEKETESQLQVSTIGSIVGDRQQYIDTIDKTLTEESINKNINQEDSDKNITNITIEKTTQNGNPTRIVTADMEENGKRVGIFRYFVTFGDKKIYMIIIGAHTSDPGFMANTAKITDSFKIK